MMWFRGGTEALEPAGAGGFCRGSGWSWRRRQALAQDNDAVGPVVTIDATGGDVRAAGASVTISGTAANIRAAGASVDVSADAAGSVWAAGGRVVLERQRRHRPRGGGQRRSHSPAGRRAAPRSPARQSTVDGSIGGNLRARRRQPDHRPNRPTIGGRLEAGRRQRDGGRTDRRRGRTGRRRRDLQRQCQRHGRAERRAHRRRPARPYRRRPHGLFAPRPGDRRLRRSSAAR